MKENTLSLEAPRVYVACLAAYNAGRLHGAWLEVLDVDGLQEGIQSMLAASPEPDAEEWAIHDYEGFGSVRLSEYAGLESVVTMADFIQEHGAVGALVLEHYGGDIEEARQVLEESYAGCHTSLGEFAEHLAEDTGSLALVPESFRYYIDFEAMGRGMELNGNIFTLETCYQQVHVFWNH